MKHNNQNKLAPFNKTNRNALHLVGFAPSYYLGLFFEVNMLKVKRCRKCGEIWEIKDFRPFKKNRDGFSHFCNKCNPIKIAKPNMKQQLKMLGWGESMRPYLTRKKSLNRIGFASYKEYLESEMWSDIRYNILKRDNYKCIVCGCEANNVHHKKYYYKVLLGIDKDNLVSLCTNCHKLIEFSNNKKNGLIQANRKLKKLVAVK